MAPHLYNWAGFITCLVVFLLTALITLIVYKKRQVLYFPFSATLFFPGFFIANGISYFVYAAPKHLMDANSYAGFPFVYYQTGGWIRTGTNFIVLGIDVLLMAVLGYLVGKALEKTPPRHYSFAHIRQNTNIIVFGCIFGIMLAGISVHHASVLELVGNVFIGTLTWGVVWGINLLIYKSIRGPDAELFKNPSQGFINSLLFGACGGIVAGGFTGIIIGRTNIIWAQLHWAEFPWSMSHGIVSSLTLAILGALIGYRKMRTTRQIQP